MTIIKEKMIHGLKSTCYPWDNSGLFSVSLITFMLFMSFMVN